MPNKKRGSNFQALKWPQVSLGFSTPHIMPNMSLETMKCIQILQSKDVKGKTGKWIVWLFRSSPPLQVSKCNQRAGKLQFTTAALKKKKQTVFYLTASSVHNKGWWTGQGQEGAVVGECAVIFVPADARNRFACTPLPLHHHHHLTLGVTVDVQQLWPYLAMWGA